MVASLCPSHAPARSCNAAARRESVASRRVLEKEAVSGLAGRAGCAEVYEMGLRGRCAACERASARQGVAPAGVVELCGTHGPITRSPQLDLDAPRFISATSQ